MRKRGADLDSPEANFMYGGPENEPAFVDPEAKVVPYDRATAAVDHASQHGKDIAPDQVLNHRDETVAQIDRNIHAAAKIEADSAAVAKKFNELSDSSQDIDQQG